MRGVSPIVATTVLIIIAVTLGAAILSWQTGFLQSFSGGLRESTQLEIQCSQASISVDSASYDCQLSCLPGVDHTLTLQATNRGNIPLTVTYAYLKNTTGGLFEFPFFQEIGVGETLQLVNVSGQSCTGINQVVDEVVLLTHCIDTSAEFPGEAISWINC